jgi:hemerythrin-like domain-containing protein
MEHNVIQTMLDEHELICKSEAIVEQLKDTWESNPEGYVETARQLLTFFREYADGYHHRKEEEILFPALIDSPEFTLDEMVEEFEAHHQDFRDTLAEIESLLQSNEMKESFGLLESYLQDLLDHIGAENDELFVLAENLLEPDELETLYFKCKDIDMELGEARKLELEQQLEGLLD